jgi:hypothetical protein
MLQYDGLISKYKNVGKTLQPKTLEDRLDQHVEYDVPLKPFASVVQLNSDYLELIDRWNYDRGVLTLFMLFGIGLMSAICCIMVYYFFPHFAEDGVLFSGLEILLVIFCIISVGFCFFGLSRESFTYTYYPTRFNRKLRKVYVIKPNKKLLVANWDDIVFVRQDIQDQADLRGYILNEQGVVTDAFCLPYMGSNSYSDNMTGHWEFVRRYMESPTGVKEAYDATYKLFPISQRKETTTESIERAQLITSNYTEKAQHSQGINTLSNILFLIMLPIMIFVIIGRRISILTSRTPHFPQWVQDECKVNPKDAYNLAIHPHPLHVETARPFKVRAALGALYLVLAIISVYLVAGFIDLVSGMKGHDTGLVRMLEFWNW